MTETQVFNDFAIILELTDAELQFIEEEPMRLYHLQVMQDLMKSKGTNAHIIQLTINNSIKISPYVEMLLKNYTTVSWINRENVFHIKRNITALLN